MMRAFLSLLALCVLPSCYASKVNAESQERSLRDTASPPHNGFVATDHHARHAAASHSQSSSHSSLTEVEGCSWTSPHGFHYDLSALAGQYYEYPSARYHSHWGSGHHSGVDAHGFSYTMAVCGNVHQVPHNCEALKRSHPAPAYQSAGGFCYALGSLHHATWHQMSEHEANLGVELVYKDGQMCAHNRPREIRYHFICAKHWGTHEHPLLVHETPERCHYNVTWPTRHACPTVNLKDPLTWSFFGTLWWLSFFFILYIVVGCCVNVARDEATVGWDALPHRDFWENRVCRRCCPDRMLQRMGLHTPHSALSFDNYPMKAEAAR